MPQFVVKTFFATVRVCMCNININNFLIFFLTEMFKIKLLAFSLPLLLLLVTCGSPHTSNNMRTANNWRPLQLSQHTESAFYCGTCILLQSSYY